MATKARKTHRKKAEADLPPIHEATEEEWHDLIDRTAQYYLHMSADEFIQRWRAGEYPEPDGTPMMNVLMLLSLDDQRAGKEAVERRLRGSAGQATSKKIEEPLPPGYEVTEEEDLPEIREATPEEWHALIDEAARYHLNMSADEFIRRWKAGGFPNPDGTPVMHVAMLLLGDDIKTG